MRSIFATWYAARAVPLHTWAAVSELSVQQNGVPYDAHDSPFELQVSRVPDALELTLLAIDIANRHYR